MISEQDELQNKLLTCQICSQRFDVPKLLQCGNTICSRCLKNDETSFKCRFCENIHEIPANGLPTNLMLMQFLQMKPVKEPKQESQNSLEKELKDLKSNIEIIKVNSNEINTKINEHCDIIREKIESRANSLIEQINKYRKSLLDQVDICMKASTEDFSNNNFDVFIEENVKKYDNAMELLKKADVNEDDLKNKFNEVKVLNENLNQKIRIAKEFNPVGYNFKFIQPNSEIDKSLIGTIKSNEVIKLESVNNNLNFNSISYKPVDNQTIYDYKYFVSPLSNEQFVIGLNVKIKTTKTYKLKIIIFNYNGNIIKEMEPTHEANKNFKQLENLSSFNNLIYCTYVDDSFYCKTSIFDTELNIIKEVKLGFTINSMCITNTKIYALLNISIINVYDLHFEKLDSFGQLINSEDPFYMENTMEIFIRNERIYLRNNDNKTIKVLSLNDGSLLKTVEIDLENCLLRVNDMSNFLIVHQTKKKLYIYDDDGVLLSENNLNNVQNVSSFCVTENKRYLINDFTTKTLYIF